jgi:hypothetical protein
MNLTYGTNREKGSVSPSYNHTFEFFFSILCAQLDDNRRDPNCSVTARTRESGSEKQDNSLL